jgi:hypothetical protein
MNTVGAGLAPALCKLFGIQKSRGLQQKLGFIK